jgi:RNA polymerase sigma-70 factor, ECF subfamily
MTNDTLQRELPHLLPRLWRFALRLARDTHDAEDLVQRTCVRALERRAQWQPGTALLSWLFAIEHSVWINELRTAQRRRTGSLDAGGFDDGDAIDLLHDVDSAAGTLGVPAPSSAGNPETLMHYRQVVQAVEALPEAQRVVMLLVAVEGLSYREAAEVLAVPIGTVMSRLARARATVGQRFMDHNPLSAPSPAALAPPTTRAATPGYAGPQGIQP